MCGLMEFLRGVRSFRIFRDAGIHHAEFLPLENGEPTNGSNSWWRPSNSLPPKFLMRGWSSPVETIRRPPATPNRSSSNALKILSLNSEAMFQKMPCPTYSRVPASPSCPIPRRPDAAAWRTLLAPTVYQFFVQTWSISAKWRRERISRSSFIHQGMRRDWRMR